MTTEFAAIQTYTQRVAREAIDQAARGRLQVPTWRPGTLVEDALPGGEIDVRLDGDTDPIGAINATGMSMGESSRGLVLLHPPHGATIVNYISGSNWLDYEPEMTGITLGDGTVTGSYMQLGNTVLCRGQFLLGATSAVTGSMTFTVPVDAAYTLFSGTVHCFAWTGADAGGVCVADASTTVMRVKPNGGTANTAAGVPFAWTFLDALVWSVTYEAE